MPTGTTQVVVRPSSASRPPLPPSNSPPKDTVRTYSPTQGKADDGECQGSPASSIPLCPHRIFLLVAVCCVAVFAIPRAKEQSSTGPSKQVVLAPASKEVIGVRTTLGPGAACPLGALPGTWDPTAPHGARWKLLDPGCSLVNWVQTYAAASAAAGAKTGTINNSPSSTSGGSPTGRITAAAAVSDADSSQDPEFQVMAVDGDAAAESGGTQAVGEAGEGGQMAEAVAADSAGGNPPAPLRLLLLSDSVDRHVVEHLCAYIGGTKETTSLRREGISPEEVSTAASGPTSTSEAQRSVVAEPGAAAAGPAASGVRPVTGGAPEASASSTSSSSSGPTPLTMTSSSSSTSRNSSSSPNPLTTTAYAFHQCRAPTTLRIASSYFPGVHPTGPYHRDLAQNFRQRVSAAAALWSRFSPEGPPQAVAVASALWDVARLVKHEPHRVAGPELVPEVLQEWIANFTAMLDFAREVFPETKVWMTHTTLLPKYDPATGLMAKPYLGRYYYIKQLNAAAATAASSLGLQLVDYSQVGEHFMVGQGYLGDLIHPNAEVGLELANLLMNTAHQQLQQPAGARSALATGRGAAAAGQGHDTPLARGAAQVPAQEAVGAMEQQQLEEAGVQDAEQQQQKQQIQQEGEVHESQGGGSAKGSAGDADAGGKALRKLLGHQGLAQQQLWQ